MNTILWESLGIVACLIGSAFFSGSETALTSLSGPQAQQLHEEQDVRSLKLWLDHPIKVLTAILIGNNIVNITASALATDLAHRLLSGTSASDWAIPVAVGGMTFLLLTFGEITPKAIAKRMYLRMAGPILTLMRVPYFLFYPATRVFASMTRVMMRMLGNDLDAHQPVVTAEEIEYMIDLGSREGSFSEDHERMLRSVFDFNDTVAREVMVPRTDMVAISTEMTTVEVIDILQECGHSRIPLYRDKIDDIVGIFYVKDLIPLLASHDLDEIAVKDIARPPFFVPETKRLSDLFAEFKRGHVHIAIVVDEFGGTSGIITLEDIVEEFFGEIQDEYDAEDDMIVATSADSVRADARVPFGELAHYFNVALDDTPVEYDTLGGLLMDHFDSIPNQGDELHWNGLMLRVLEADAKRVYWVSVERTFGLDEESSEARLVS